MLEKYKLGRWEIACIVLNVLTYKVFTGFPRLFTEISGTAAWLTCLFSGAVTFGVIALILWLYKKLGAVNILEAAEIATGKAGKWIAGVILLVYLIFSNAIALREFTEVMKTVAFPSAALAFVMLFFAAAMVIGAVGGFDAIARLHVLAVPIALIITIIMIFSALPAVSVNNLFPVLGTGAENVFGKGLVTVSAYSDIVFLFLINPFAKSNINWRRTGLFSALGGIVICVVTIFIFNMLVPYPSSADVSLPIYSVAKAVRYGRFFQRADSFYMLAIAIQGMLYLSLSLFFTLHIFADIFKLPHSRPMIWMFGLLGFLLALTVQRGDELHKLVRCSAYFMWAAAFLPVLIFAAAARIKYRKKGAAAGESK